MDKAKVLYITYNGVGEPIFRSQCLPYLKGLSGKGYRITLLSYERDFTKAAERSEEMRRIGIRWFRLRYHKRPRAAVTLYDFILGMKLSFFIVLFGRIDIVHARATHGALMGAPSAKLLGRKFIFDTRGLDSEEYSDGGLIRAGSVMHRILLNIEGLLFSASDAIVLLSEKARELLSEKRFGRYLHNRPVYVIPCAADLERFGVNPAKNTKKRGFKLIYTGSIGTWYMIDEMLEFFKALKRRIQNSEFTIFTQSDKEDLNRKIEMSGVAHSVKVDYTPHEFISQAIAAADAGICLIKAVSSKRASSPTKIGEYLACGLPVVINPGIGDTETLIRAKRVGVVLTGFDMQDYEEAAGKLSELLREEGLAARCRSAAEEQFSLADAVSKYDTMYTRLVSGHKRR